MKIKIIKLFVIVFLISSFKTLAQNTYSVEVTYKVNLKFDFSKTMFSKLNFNNRKSYYIKDVKSEDIESEEKKKEEYSNSKVRVIKYKSNYKPVINTDLKSNTILSKVKLGEEFFLVKEELTRIKWKIFENKTDTILGYKCLKATGNFRGRLFTVWFTKEIPARFGPWKLNGLPGLILEAKDHLDQVEFIAYRIEHFKKDKEFIHDFPKKGNNYKIINLKEYVTKLDEDLRSRVQAIIAKMPRNYNIVNLKYKGYKGIELEYEWEKD